VNNKIECRTQDQADKAIADGDIPILVEGNFSLTITGTASPLIIVMAKAVLELIAWESSQPRVEARESSQPRVVAWGSSQPRVVARESSQPRVEAWGSSQPRVEAWESSQPRVEARGSSQPRVEAWESSQPRVEARESSQPRVVARESSQPRVEARESSQPRVVAWESSQPRVVAWGSSQPRVEAWGSSQPRVEARGYVQLSIFGAVIAKAASTVSVLIHGTRSKVAGGKKTRVNLKTGANWCSYYGVPVKAGVAVLYKAVRDDFKTGKFGFLYQPGTKPISPDWDGPARECGGGLHFSPSPRAALEFDSEATRFVACPVKVSEIVIHPNGSYPQKCKAPRVYQPCYEVNEDGDRIPDKIKETP